MTVGDAIPVRSKPDCEVQLTPEAHEMLHQLWSDVQQADRTFKTAVIAALRMAGHDPTPYSIGLDRLGERILELRLNAPQQQKTQEVTIDPDEMPDARGSFEAKRHTARKKDR